MEILHFLPMKKGYFLLYLPTKLAPEVENWYAHLVGALDALLSSLNISASLHLPFYKVTMGKP